jgi:flagellar biogenesis protein FliO
MTKQEKYRVLLLMTGVAILLLFLAAGITRMNMQPGHPFPLEWKQPQSGGGTLGNGTWFLVLIRGFLILCAITVPIYVFINLLTPQGRRRLLKGLIQLLVLLLALYLLSRLADTASKKNQEQQARPTFALEGGQPATDGQAQNPVQQETKAPPWLDVGICLGLAFVLAILITVLAWGMYRASRERAGDAMARLADEAQDAVDALQAGGNIRDTVIRCYIQMTQVLAKERNVRREEAMTPHEFEQILLTKMKLPETPVQRLTRLFEAVRYGDYHPGKREELEAIDSLTAIAEACKIVKT